MMEIQFLNRVKITLICFYRCYRRRECQKNGNRIIKYFKIKKIGSVFNYL